LCTLRFDEKATLSLSTLPRRELDIHFASVDFNHLQRVDRFTSVYVLRPVYSDTTQLNSTDLLRADWLYAATGSVVLLIVGDSLSCVGEGVYSDATQLNSTRRRVELSCVAINEPYSSQQRRETSLSGNRAVCGCGTSFYSAVARVKSRVQ